MQRTILYAALVVATAAAWFVAVWQSAGASLASPYLTQALCGNGVWNAADVVACFVMWMGMMVAMMLPATAPTAEAFATITRRRRARGQPYTPTFVFIAGYCLAWGGFSAAATLAQWLIYRGAVTAPTPTSATPLFAGAALLVAGLYQFTPLKRACLQGCRGPLAFIIAEWREGHSGALIMGLRHGLLCVGCCWAVMGLMFCVSAMDLRWAAALAIYAAVEKLMPGGDSIVAPAFGSAAIVGGVALLAMCFF